VAGILETARPEPGHLAGMSSGGKGRVRSELGLDSPYRTIYLPILRDLLPDEYGTFDFPDPSGVNGLRHVTTAPTQALFFMNSPFVESAARRTAHRLLDSAGSDRDRITQAYRLILGRNPNSQEIDDALALFDSSHADTATHRWTILIQSLFATAEFRYIL